MFTRPPDLVRASEPVEITVDGSAIHARAGDTVASAMLASGLLCSRTTPTSGAPRAPFCMMGVCFECLVTIDGVGSQQACLVAVTPGMVVATQCSLRAIGSATGPA